MKLVIVHYHLRPGGIRRIIELATPHLQRQAKIDSVVLACGEAADCGWNEAFVRAMGTTPVEFFVEPGFNYISEQRLAPTRLRLAITRALRCLLDGANADNCVVWAHNLGVARNVILTRELTRACEQRGIPLLAHHHDWWFDNRWLRWPEMRRFGVRALTSAARTIMPATKSIRHIAINRADATTLQRHFRNRAAWLPNLIERGNATAARRIHTTNWLQPRLGEKNAPIWILPCRLLRRKNVAEALLLTRWLRPEAWLITTGGVSSQEERRYFEKLNAGAQQHHWRLRLGVLAGVESRKPSVTELMAASECVILTSLQEGFGLPYLEAAAANRPLIARSLPNIAPDLARFGFRFPQSYEDVIVHSDLFDWQAERTTRQEKLFARWKRQLPATLRRLATDPAMLAARAKPNAVPFSRLTLDAQLEVLAQPVNDSWKQCAPLNPFLPGWRQRAARRKLQVTPWPRTAERWLSGPAYAKSFLRILRQRPTAQLSEQASRHAQIDFFEKKLAATNNYPLLWEAEA